VRLDKEIGGAKGEKNLESFRRKGHYGVRERSEKKPESEGGSEKGKVKNIMKGGRQGGKD